MARLSTPAHRVTTAHLQAAYPFIADQGLGGRGVYIGQDVAGGGAFCYDPFVLYEDGVLTDPNMVVMGHLGRGKSSFVKTYIMRQTVFGRKAAVMDPKGEYGDLAAVYGVEPVRLAPGGEVRLNPLDPGPNSSERNSEEIAARQETLLVAVAEAALNRALLPAEQTACRLALEDVRATTDQPTIPMVADALFTPTEESAERIHTSVSRLKDEGRELALTFKRLCEGDLRGMFDGETNVEIDWNGPLVVLDLSPLHQSPALPILMTCAAAWLQAIFARKTNDKRIVVVDEAWSILRTLGIARWMQANFKLARAYGVQNIIVLHRPSDLKATGDAGTEQRQIAEGLLSDAGTRIIYAQSTDEIALSSSLLGLTSTEAQVLPLLGKGEALWRVGSRSFLVRHLVGKVEKPIVDTDARMKDKIAG
jgi:type IV secretory pathway VirB4 component